MTPMPTRRRGAALLALVASVLAVAAPAPQADDLATIRFVHLSPDTPLVDVLVDGRLTFRDLAFLQRSGAVTLPAGRHEVRVFPHRPPRRATTATSGEAGTTRAPGPLEPVVTVLNLPAGSVTTLVLTGGFEPPTEEGGRGALSIQVEPGDAEIAVEGPRGFRGLYTGDQFLVGLEPGPYRASVRRSGYEPAEYETDVAANATAVVTITLQDADDDAEEATAPVRRAEQHATWRGLELQPYRDERVPLAAAGHALVRFVHAAPTVPDLDLTAGPAHDADGGVSAFDVLGLTYPNASEYREAAAARYDLEAFVAGTASLVHAVGGVDLAPGVTYTVFVSADPVNNEVWFVPIVDAVVPQLVPRAGAP